MKKRIVKKSKHAKRPVKQPIGMRALSTVSPWLPAMSVLGGLSIAAYKAAQDKKAADALLPAPMLMGDARMFYVADRPTYAMAPRRSTLGWDIPWGAIIGGAVTIGVAAYGIMAKKKTEEKMAAAKKKAQAAADAEAAAAAVESQRIAEEQVKTAALSAAVAKESQWAAVKKYGTLAAFIIGGGVGAWLLAKSFKKQEK